MRWIEAAEPASAEESVIEAQQNVFHLAGAEFGVEKVQRHLAGEATVWSFQPDAGFLQGAQGFGSLGDHMGYSIEPIRLLGVEVPCLLPAGKGSRRDANN